MTGGKFDSSVSVLQAGDAYLVNAVLCFLSFTHPVLDHASSQLGVVEGVDEHLVIQDVALGFLQQLQCLGLQLLS